jgi:integrase
LLDYRRHLERYVLPVLGNMRLADLRPSNTRDLQADLLERKSSRHRDKCLSVKFVKNIIGGSYRELIMDAVDEGLIRHPVFPRKMRWPKWEPPEADPFTAEERDLIIKWFHVHPFRHPTGNGKYLLRPHPPFHVFVHILFWTGLRPSEATGLQDRDIDYGLGRAQVRRSRHLYAYGEPKTRNARRTIELFPTVVALLRSIRQLRVTQDTPVFTNIIGRALDQQAFTRHWYECLRSLGIRQRGIYCMKDTFVTTALVAGVNIRWLEQQTGEDYATLKKHYSRWMPLEIGSELRRFNSVDPTLFTPKQRQLSPRKRRRRGQFPISVRNKRGIEVVPRGFEPLLPT